MTKSISFDGSCTTQPELCIPIILGIQSFAYPPSAFTGVFPAVLEVRCLNTLAQRADTMPELYHGERVRLCIRTD